MARKSVWFMILVIVFTKRLCFWCSFYDSNKNFRTFSCWDYGIICKCKLKEKFKIALTHIQFFTCMLYAGINSFFTELVDLWSIFCSSSRTFLSVHCMPQPRMLLHQNRMDTFRRSERGYEFYKQRSQWS